METSNPTPIPLARLAKETGTSVPCAANLPLDMGEAEYAWFIEKGTVDLFMVERKDETEQTAPQHLLRATAGRLLPGVAPDTAGSTLTLVAKGLPGTELRRVPMSSLNGVSDAELAKQVDSWITDISTVLSRYDSELTRPDVVIKRRDTSINHAGTVSALRGVVWLSGLSSGDGFFLGTLDPSDGRSEDEGEEGEIPLVPTTWISLTGSKQLSVCTSETLAEKGRLIPALARFHALTFSVERLNRGMAVADQANLERERIANRRTDEDGARHDLFDLYGLARDTEIVDTALLDALDVIGKHEGIDFIYPREAGTTNSSDLFTSVLDASGVRARRVRLSQDSKWWRNCSGAILAFREEDGRPVTLIRNLWGRYLEVDPSEHHTARITARRAQALRAEAWLFYEPLGSAPATLNDLFRLAFKRLTVDCVRYVAMGFLGGLVMLIPAVILGFVADEVIPGGDVDLLYVVCIALVTVALIGSLLQVLQGMALMRIEGRAASRADAAFWDRLLRLPSHFLRGYSSGDLALRGSTFQTLRDAVQDVVANSVLSIIFLLPVFLLIFAYEPRLAGVTAIFALISLTATVILGLRQITPHGRVVRAMQHLAGQLFQIINGISVLRIAGAEGSAFAVWAREYREQKQGELERDAVEEHVQALSAAMPLLTGVVLLASVTFLGGDTITIGDFLVVFTAFMVFQTAVARLGASFSAVAAILPTIEQVKPLLEEPPEISSEGEPVEILTGDIKLDHICFRYNADGPLILNDVSIHINPGEFVAITGESGAGKSTLFRLMLGLDKPASGAVYYDGRDIRQLNVKQVRRKIGAVPQTVQLHPDDVWDNIVGDHEGATTDDVWEAARLAVIDEQIASMPMKMMTFVGAGGGTSGGESQRITIAHALLSNPRILLFDEATNWLDNESQAQVMENLTQMNTTRVVIAHRLSTLRQADRIYVLQDGQVVEEGNFEELLGRGRIFANLVRRQMA